MRPPKTPTKKGADEPWSLRDCEKTMFQQNLKLKNAYELVKVIRYLWQKNSVWHGMHMFFWNLASASSYSFQLNLSHSDMYSALVQLWLLQFQHRVMALPVAVTFWTFELVAGETPAVLSTSRNVKKTLMAPQTTNKQNNDMHMCESVTTRTGYD